MNAGKYNKKISIYSTTYTKDASGFPIETETLVLSCKAEVKTTKGITLIKNDTDFEKAYTNFTIRYPHVSINRDMTIHFADRVYTIEYLNNLNEDGLELEMQCKEVTH